MVHFGLLNREDKFPAFLWESRRGFHAPGHVQKRRAEAALASEIATHYGSPLPDDLLSSKSAMHLLLGPTVGTPFLRQF
jgi:hypothetical protein